jgi:hypothetical protein
MVVTTSTTQIAPALKRQGRIGGGGDDDIIRACRGLAILTTKEVKR